MTNNLPSSFWQSLKKRWGLTAKEIKSIKECLERWQDCPVHKATVETMIEVYKDKLNP